MRLRLLAAMLIVAIMGEGVACTGGHAAEIGIDVAEGRLHGTLLLPAADGEPHPVALILAGSGPTDRDGNQPGLRNDAYRLLAEGLAAHGIASLRFDKRGIGASSAVAVTESDLTVEPYVQEVLAWMGFLAGDTRFSSTFLVGHSEGALLATLAAERAAVSGVVLVAGAGRPAADAIRWQFDRIGLPPDLRVRAEVVLAELEEGRPVAAPPQELATLFRPSVQPYLMSWFAIDPVERVGRLEVPVSVVHGTTDLQVPVEDARKLASARPGIRLVVLDGVNHILREAPDERSANLATYSRPELPLAAGLVEAISAFIRDLAD